jgi:uncharacterized membrane protein YfcA
MSPSLTISLMIIGLLVGFSKTGFAGVGIVCAALLTALLPAKESMGSMLILLIVGDLFAIGIYRRNVEWKILRKLMWPIFAGILIGAYFLAHSSNNSLKHTIGWIVLLLSISFPFSKRVQNRREDLGNFPRVIGNTLGTLTGFMSMVSNSGGPPMSIFLLLRGVPVVQFIGTNAWIFFFINQMKLPFALWLGMINLHSLQYLVPTLPMMPVGAFLGRKFISKINQKLFQKITLAAAFLAGLNLIIR